MLAATPATGREVSCIAAAAGATSSAKISSVPTIRTVIATDSARIRRKAIESAATGTPRASATSGSTDANTSGRPISAALRSYWALP